MRLPGTRRSKPSATVSIALLASSLFCAVPCVAHADQLDKLLRRPLTPGSIALLAPHVREKRVSERLRLALGSSEADTRGVAARLVNLGALSDLLGEVTAALTKETEPEAAREEMRALCSVGGPPYDEAVIAAAARFVPELDRALVRILARVRGPQALDLYFRSLSGMSLSPSERVSFFRLASRGQKEPLIAAAAMALGRRDTATWQAVLNVAAELGLALDEPVMIEALRSREPVFRGEAAWYLAKTYCGGAPPNATEMLSAVAEADAAGPEAVDPELRFGSEILRRVLGGSPVEDDGWIACLQSNPSCHLDSDFLESPLIDFLTPREREAILRRNEANRPPEAMTRGKKAGSKNPNTVELRLVSGLPKGLARGLLETAGCTPGWFATKLSVANLAFRADGLPRQVSVDVAPRGTPCSEAASSLFLMTLAPSNDYLPPDKTVAYAALLDPDSLVCNEESALVRPSSSGSSPDVVRVRANVVPPKPVKKVAPVYPAAARRRQESGVSIYEAIIAPTGCVRDLRLLQSSAPQLDLSGLEAISHWRYTPASLDGKPVSVYLTVTATFSLH